MGDRQQRVDRIESLDVLPDGPSVRRADSDLERFLKGSLILGACESPIVLDCQIEVSASIPTVLS